MARKIIKIDQAVKALMEKDKRYSDNDNSLCARIWANELVLMGMESRNISAYEFLCLYATDKLTNSDSVTRARRKLEEEIPELRGNTYDVRHSREVNKTKGEVNSLKDKYGNSNNKR